MVVPCVRGREMSVREGEASFLLDRVVKRGGGGGGGAVWAGYVQTVNIIKQFDT